jgi:septum formation protein
VEEGGEPPATIVDVLILASRSPRRREILENAGLRFIVRPAEVEEKRLAGESAEAYVKRVARAKAEAIEAGARDIVLGADTVVAVDDEILGKPADREEATRMLRRLSGREHVVMTGICLRSAARLIEDVEATRVQFVPLSRQEIRDYVASGEPMDKAGAYAIQGLASKFVGRVAGCYCNVVGLPIALVYRRLKELDGDW